jgi:hypothetical protein
MNQKEATYKAITDALYNRGITLSQNTPVKKLLTSDIKSEIRNTLFKEFRAGNVDISDEFKASLSDDSKLKKYVAGLVSNWLRKDKRLNGNVKHQIKNPGVRVGQGDAQVKELRKLLKRVKGTDAEVKVKKALDSRIAEVRASKEQKINVENLPEHLRELV